MKSIAVVATAFAFCFGIASASAQALIDKGFVAGWNVMVDPSFGNGCLIQTIFEDHSVVRLGYDAENNRSYFVVFNKAWKGLKKGETADITFDLDGEIFTAKATGFVLNRVPGAGVFFDDREFVHAIAKRKVMTLYRQDGQKVMAIDFKGSGKAIKYGSSPLC